MSENPYAPIEQQEPRWHGGGPGSSGSGLVDEDGKHLFVTSPARLPARCVRSNREDDLIEMSKPMYFVHPATWLGLVLCGLPGVAVLYLIFRKKVEISYSINRQERNSRRLKSVIAFLVFAGGIGMLVIGGSQQIDILLPLGIVMLFAGLILMVIFGNYIAITGHKNGVFRVKGCSPEFLRTALDGMDDPYHDPGLDRR